MKEQAFDSIGVFQELCKEVCIANGVTEKQAIKRVIMDHGLLTKATHVLLKDYGQRHITAFRSFVAKSPKDNRPTPNLAYYVAKALLQSKFSEITHGLKREHIEERIRSDYHDKEGFRPAELATFLSKIVSYQQGRRIKPPLFDYDQVSRVLRIIDSTLFFYLKHSKDTMPQEINEAGGG